MDEEFLQTGKGKGRCYRTSNHQPDRYPISGNLHFGSSGIGKHILGQSGWRQRSALLSATNDGTELNKRTGKYKDIFVVGFDSGSSQRKALKVGEFLGSATQDRYQMGYQLSNWPPRERRFPIPIPGHTGTTAQTLTIPISRSCSTTKNRWAQKLPRPRSSCCRLDNHSHLSGNTKAYPIDDTKERREPMTQSMNKPEAQLAYASLAVPSLTLETTFYSSALGLPLGRHVDMGA